jgi:hypothetical protein
MDKKKSLKAFSFQTLFTYMLEAGIEPARV